MEHPYHRSDMRLKNSDIDALGHIIRVPLLKDGDEGYNTQIEVLDPKNEGDRAQIYQMWTITQFAEHPVAIEALAHFNLAGDTEGKENWTQLLEHIAGVTAIALRLESILEKHGASTVNADELKDATLYDNLEKPYAILAGREGLATAALVHDVEKPAELAAAKDMMKRPLSAGGLENSLDNPIIRDGALWRWLQAKKVDEGIIIAAQNTGRSDRLYSEYDDYPEGMIKKVIVQREALAELLSVPVDIVDGMSPTERRRKSIESKGRMAAIVGIADALAAQFKFQGIKESDIDATSDYYLSRKKDPESVMFFGQDWPEYYKQVRQYMIEQVPAENRVALVAELDELTHEDIFNETVLPTVLGETNPLAAQKLRYRRSP